MLDWRFIGVGQDEALGQIQGRHGIGKGADLALAGDGLGKIVRDLDELTGVRQIEIHFESAGRYVIIEEYSFILKQYIQKISLSIKTLHFSSLHIFLYINLISIFY